MVNQQLLLKLDSRVRAMDTPPPHTLKARRAVEMLAEALGIAAHIEEDRAGWLKVTRTGVQEEWLIKASGAYYEGDLIGVFTDCVETVKFSCMENLAWKAIGHLFLPRHVAAAQERFEKDPEDAFARGFPRKYVRRGVPPPLVNDEFGKEFQRLEGVFVRRT